MRLSTIVKTWLILVVALLGVPAFAQQAVQVGVGAVLGDKVLLLIDGKRKLLSKGQTVAGVKLLSFDNRRVQVQIGAQKLQLRLGEAPISSQYSKQKRAQVTLYSDANGMFSGSGSINGQRVEFLVDTGATTVALSKAVAKRVGIDLSAGKAARRVQVQTANGVASAYEVMLDKVTLGDISAPMVRALVIDGGVNQVLLGMSFLERVKVEHAAGTLKLSASY